MCFEIRILSLFHLDWNDIRSEYQLYTYNRTALKSINGSTPIQFLLYLTTFADISVFSPATKFKRDITNSLTTERDREVLKGLFADKFVYLNLILWIVICDKVWFGLFLSGVL